MRKTICKLARIECTETGTPAFAGVTPHVAKFVHSGRSGTPTEWLGETFQSVIEVFCDCPPNEAASRFSNRSRHPGHCDCERDFTEILRGMNDFAGKLPLNVGSTVRVDTSQDVDIADVVTKVRQMSDKSR